MSAVENKIEKHADQLNQIQRSLGEVITKIEVLINDHDHLSKSVATLSESIKKLTEIDYLVKGVEGSVGVLKEKVQELENGLKKHDKLIIELERKSNRFSNFIDILRQHWFLISVAFSVFVVVYDNIGKIIKFIAKI